MDLSHMSNDDLVEILAGYVRLPPSFAKEDSDFIETVLKELRTRKNV